MQPLGVKKVQRYPSDSVRGRKKFMTMHRIYFNKYRREASFRLKIFKTIQKRFIDKWCQFSK